jgi:hypothetical protein
MGILMFLPTMLASRADLLVENLALRQQLAVLKRSVKRPNLRKRDRVFWVWLSTLWSSWRSILLIVQPETVIRWHRLGFKLYWHRKSKPGKSGRPTLDREIRNLIRRMSRENPLWGAPKILSELLLLGYEPANGRQIYGKNQKTAITGLANVLEQSYARYRGLRFLHSSYSRVSRSLRLHCSLSRSTKNRPLQHHGESHC